MPGSTAFRVGNDAGPEALRGSIRVVRKDDRVAVRIRNLAHRPELGRRTATGP